MVIKVWEVVGGGHSGGIVVRAGQKLSSDEASEKLQRGSLIEEVSLVGERLQYRLMHGRGPATGWVSLKLKEQALVAEFEEPKLKMSGGPEDFGDKLIEIKDYETKWALSVADAMGETWEGYRSPHADDPEWKLELKRAFRDEYAATEAKVKDQLGKWKVVVAPTASAFSGPLHYLCCCLAETGHLTPLLRIARACCQRELVGRVSFVTNTFGASKVAKWLQSDPDKTGKLCLYSFEDGWTESLQTQCNFFAQNEDGSLMGISNNAISNYCRPVVQSIVNGKLPVSCIIKDMASMGYDNAFAAGLESSNKKLAEKFQALQKCLVISAPATILGCFVFESFKARVLLHCFMNSQLAPLLMSTKAMMSVMASEQGKEQLEIGDLLDGKKDMTEVAKSMDIATMMQNPEVALPDNVRAVGIIADDAKADKLPQHLVDFLEKPGPVVYVSMGSVAAFDKEQLTKVLEGLKAPGEWRVIWSLRQNQQDLLPDGWQQALGDDFLVSSWLPQAELLMHKKVTCFMSHCGWGASCEAMLSATPVVCFPMFADQNANASLLNILGMGKTVTCQPFKLDMMNPVATSEQLQPMMTVSQTLRHEFTSDGLREDIRLVLSDKKFTAAAKAVRAMNHMYKGGAGRAAEEVENAVFELNPNCKR